MPDYSQLYKDKTSATLDNVSTFSTIQSWVNPRSSILDIACGIGYLLNFVGGGTGVDINHELISECKKKYPKNKFIISDCYSIPIKSDQFDTIIMCMIIEHLDKPEKALLEAKRLLKSGGNLIVVTPRKNDWFYKFFVKKDPTHVKEYTSKELKELLSKYFKIDKIRFGSVSTKIPWPITYMLKSDIIVNCIK
jgi:ubiquinone/menaquinone biosynthesis C-methylase UbiE